MTSPAQSALSHPPLLAGDVTVETPRHPVPALTTYELRDYRRELERAITEIAPDAPVQAHLRRKLETVIAEQEDRARLAVRDYDVTGLTGRQLERDRRELTASLALVRPDSPARVPILAQMSAIDTELAGRTGERPEDLPDSPIAPVILADPRAQRVEGGRPGIARCRGVSTTCPASFEHGLSQAARG